MNAENQVKSGAATAVVGETARPKRRINRSVLMGVVPLAMVVVGGWFWLAGGRYEETQDANLHQPRVAISSNATGLVTQIGFTDNQPVKKGDLLFQVDPAPFKLALAAANAALAGARLNVEQMKVAYASAVTQQHVAEDQVTYLDSELTRQEALANKGVAATTAVDDARHAAVIARGQLETAKQQVINALAALGGKPDIVTDDHPTVQAALAARDTAQFNLDQSTLRAPADGIVYQADSFKPGQYVVAGTPVFTLVETSDVWVEADFKENQLTHVQPGQAVTVAFDLYPGRSFTGKVEAIGAGTGAEFALIPAENATGNWVKVTQRIPVRIALDLGAGTPPLHSGMSADVSVDTGRIRHLSDLLPAAFVNP
ncbi:MAG: HlyD family efflux transporter periplasmic adaptor subunit [Rhodobacteraceae bacterium]|nr:HlyD family efflux transporter periplasmic adaptor subunit [Paracoccaceae bacterium]